MDVTWPTWRENLGGIATSGRKPPPTRPDAKPRRKPHPAPHPPQDQTQAARVDGAFEDRARAWLHDAASAEGWDPKTASALLALLEDDASAIEAALAVGLASDVDDGGAIARDWGTRMEALLPAG